MTKAKTIRGRILEALKKEKEGLTDPELAVRVGANLYEMTRLRVAYQLYYSTLLKLKEEGLIGHDIVADKWYYKKGYHRFLRHL